MAARAAEALAKAALDAGDALASSAEAYAKTASDKRLEAERNVDDAPQAALQARAAADACASAANNYALALFTLQRYAEAKPLLRRKLPMARRVLGETNETTLRMRWYYAMALYEDDGATLDNLRKAVTTLEETERTARRVLGGQHPLTVYIEDDLQCAQDALYARGLP